MQQARTGFAALDGRRDHIARREAVAVTHRGQTRIFPSYAALRDAVLADAQPMLDTWTAQAEARGRRRGRADLALAVAIAFAAGPLGILLLGALAR